MPESRIEAEAVELGPNKIWVTGGRPFLASTVVYENGGWSSGPDLPEGLEEHCMVKVDDNTIVLSGGENAPAYANNVYLFDIEAETWTEVDPMDEDRYRHACGYAE